MRTFALCCVLLVSVAASAQTVEFGIHGNILNFNVPEEITQIAGVPPATNETLALQEVFGIGYGGGIHLHLKLGILALRLAGDYSTITPDNAKFQEFLAGYVGSSASAFRVEGGKVTIYGGEVNLKITILPIPVFQPYIAGGVGLSHVKADETKITFNNTPLTPIELIKEQTVMTLNGGVGADFVLGPLSLYAEVRVNAFFLDPTTATYLPVGTIGITF
jgi:opacity protein-like surface antigen